MARNQVVLDGCLVASDTLRHTPAGIPVLQLQLAHASEQTEAGGKRRVECQVTALAFAESALQLARLAPGTALKLGGFLAQKSRNSTQLVLHVNKFELIESIED
ncbi:MAG: primosomal replication protein N [Pseudomonadota bacterium]